MVKFEFVIFKKYKNYARLGLSEASKMFQHFFCSLTKLKFHQTKLPILLTSKKLKMGAETFFNSEDTTKHIKNLQNAAPW